MSLEARAVTTRGPEDPAGPEQTPEPAPEPAASAAAEHSLAPRRPRTVGGVVFLLVLAVTLTGVVVVALSHWHAGLILSGAALLGAGCARLVLPNGQAGMLGVRRKLVDVSTLVVLGVGLLVVAALIREPVA